MTALMVLPCLVALNIIVSAQQPDLDQEWELFKADFNKTYSSEEEELKRRLIWESEVEYIRQHNEEADIGLYAYWLGINIFSDMTPEEVTENYGMTMPFEDEAIAPDAFFDPPEMALPASIDWRKRGAVTPVKDQKTCKACWAFSAIGSLEGVHALKTGKLVALSEQNLIDCVRKNGCAGGKTTEAFDYIKNNRGVDTERSYPFENTNKACRFNHKTVGATIRSWKSIRRGDEQALLTAVATVGPVSIVIPCCNKDLFEYRRGVYTGNGCHTAKARHAMVVVGYGASRELGDYWLIKNSWGKSWGRDGYVYFKRNANVCGIANAAIYPVV